MRRTQTSIANCTLLHGFRTAYCIQQGQQRLRYKVLRLMWGFLGVHCSLHLWLSNTRSGACSFLITINKTAAFVSAVAMQAPGDEPVWRQVLWHHLDPSDPEAAQEAIKALAYPGSDCSSDSDSDRESEGESHSGCCTSGPIPHICA